MARQETANVIINRVALEVGLSPVADPVADTDGSFIQLTGLLTAAGQELVELHQWQVLRQEWEFTTAVPSDTGIYDLPADFSYMIDQAGWDKTNNYPLTGPLSAQDWSYLEGRDLVSQSIYASFRITEDKLELFPQPPADAIDLRFEYISRYWITQAGSSAPDADTITIGTDVVLYEPILIIKFLKVKFLEAKGFDSSSARLELELIFNSRTGKDKGGVILSASNSSRSYPYLNPYRNLGDTGYGS
jgi:hypothetical protein